MKAPASEPTRFGTGRYDYVVSFIVVVLLIAVGWFSSSTPTTQTQAKSDSTSSQQSWEKAQRNFQSQAHDGFQCANSTENQPIVSFDGGKYWWKDDRRCIERLQKKRDEDAQISSYWPTTMRVNTDMDSFWLPSEERTCQTFPDEKGTVAIVICGSTAHANHNIPVKFWGGVDRNTVSDWKCRRETEEFVCRAID